LGSVAGENRKLSREKNLRMGEDLGSQREGKVFPGKDPAKTSPYWSNKEKGTNQEGDANKKIWERQKSLKFP